MFYDGLNISFRIKIAAFIVLLITTVNASAQNTLYFQGFEGSPCENWNYSGGVVTVGTSHTGNNSGRIGYISNTLTFSPANVAGYAGLVLTIYHSVRSGLGPGMDTREGAVLQISLNGGTYINIGSAGGYSDANWSFNSSTGGTTNGSAGCTRFTTPNPVVYSIPSGTMSVQVRVVSIRSGNCAAFNTAMINATPNLYDRADEGFYIDDVKITTTTPPPSIILISAISTDTQTVNSCGPQPIKDILYSVGPGVANVTGLPPGINYTYVAGIVTISGSPFTDGTYNYTVKNICTDSSAMGSITKTKPVPITESAELYGCNTVTFNGITYTSSIVVNDTIKSFQGCDSLYKVTTITIPQITPTTQTTSLSGCNSIVSNGITYTSSTVINDTTKSFLGCDSVYKITNVAIIPITPTTQTTNLNGCNSVVFNGITYTSSSVINDTTKSFQGCDSLYKVTTIKITPITPTTQTTSLSGCNSIVSNGITYTSSTVINDTTKSFLGCDSVYKITNVAIILITPTTQTTNLNGCNSVVFNGITYTSSSVINDTTKSFQGCDSLYKVTTIKITPITPTTQTTSLSGCNSILFNGITYTSSSVINDTTKSFQGCDSLYKVTTITITPITPTTQTINLNGCNSILFNGITYTSSIVINDTTKSFLGCDSLYKVTNIAIIPIIPTTQTTNLTSCKSVVFNGIAYTSTILINDTIKSLQGCDSLYKVTNIFITPIMPITQTTNLTNCNRVVFNGITYTSSLIINDTTKSFQGCDSLYKVTNIFITPIMPITQTTNLTSCNRVVFNGITYTSSLIINDTTKSFQGCDSLYKVTNISITPITPTTQTTNLRSCNSIVFNGTTYTSSIIINDTTKSFQGCDSLYKVTNISITPITPTTQTTNLRSCNSIVFNGTTYASSIVINDTIKSLQQCDSFYKVTNIVVKPASSSTKTVNICTNEIPYTWNGNNFNASGNYSATFSNSSSCDSIAYLHLIVNQTPSKPIFNTDTILCPGSSIVLALNSNYDHYLWQDNTTLSTFTASEAGIYSVRVFSSFGCSNSAFVKLSVNANCDDIYFPSAFSPAGMSANQRFGPLGNLNLVNNYSFHIYNRWGEIVFSSADPFQKWDGTLKGFRQNAGTFVWQANYIFKGRIKRARKGYIILIR